MVQQQQQLSTTGSSPINKPRGIRTTTISTPVNNATSTTSLWGGSGNIIPNLNNGVTYLLVLILVFPVISFVTLGSYNNLLLNLDTTTSSSNDDKTTTKLGTTKVSEALAQFKQPKVLSESQQQNQQQQQEQQQQSTEQVTKNDKNGGSSSSVLAGLSCKDHGGPMNDAEAAEMVYWEDIPSDAQYISPLKHPTDEQYITFEPDPGGWNNIRMSMETVVGMAFAMGRTLVLPPETKFYLIGSEKHTADGKIQKNQFTFANFFHMEQISYEHPGIKIITMKEFLQKEALSGHMINTKTKQVSFPPQNNRTEWDGKNDIHTLFTWLRTVSHIPTHWDPDECLAVFPNSRSDTDITELESIRDTIIQSIPKFEDYIDKPVPIDGSVIERMKESWASRKTTCIYDRILQNAKYIHFPVDGATDTRLLTHFYTFLFFQNYKTDLWMKRFIRDHVRYMDEIQCAAARIVSKIRERAKRRDPILNPNGIYDALHVRRGDFQYKKTRIDAKELLDMVKKKIPDGSSVYIATDEQDKAYFRPLMDRYHIMFMDDFIETELHGVNSNFFGMIDALVASRSRIFYGCWFSTFTGYINRLRGYHADKDKLPGYENGIINSYFYALPDRFDHMQHYYPIKKVFYAREFPTAWRLIDTTINEPI